MEKKTILLNNKGMTRDISITKANNDFAYENFNIRIIPMDKDTLLTVTNERGNKRQNLKEKTIKYNKKITVQIASDTNYYMIVLSEKLPFDIKLSWKQEENIESENDGEILIPKNTTVVADATVFDNARRYQEFINRLNKDYEKAYLEGDVETGQRMWDSWFKFRTPNNKAIDAQGNPIKTYHTVSDQYDPSFNIFDTNIERRPTAIYTTDNPIMSASYAHTPVDEATLNVK